MFLITRILLTSSLLFIVMGRHLDFRERFLERKRLRSITDQRITILNNYVLNNTVVLDDIPHYRKIKGRSSPTWKKIRALEKDFRRLLAMKGMKYNYKRDLFWRTWRSIPPVNGDTKQIVSYKCNNLIYGNTKECQNCGMWTIEDRTPPCPFEFFTVLSDEKLCGANYTQYKDVSNICPSVIKFSDLTGTCDNPIETQWRFTKMYGVTEKYDEVICKNKDFCEIFTSYEITPEHVIFRIINSTNDVIYSRIMKAKNRNYICVDNCGRFNPNTRKVAKADKPLKLDLLTVRKTKREDVQNEMNDSVTKRDVLNEINNTQMHLQTKLTKGEGVLNEINDNVLKREDVLNEMNDSLHLPKKPTKGDVSNEMNDSLPKREDVLNEINENLHWQTKLTKGEDDSNEMNDNVLKREDVLNEINEGLHLPTKLTKGEDDFNEMNDNISEREDLLSEMNDRLHLPTKLKKGEVSNEINDNVPKREDVLKEINEGLYLPTKLMKGEDDSNEMTDNIPKREIIFNEMNDSLHLPTKLKKGDVSNEMNDNVRKREDVLSEMNEDLHSTTEVTKTEVLNDILPTMEENMSVSNFGGDDYIRVSIEETRPLIDCYNGKRMSIEKNSLHKIKSRGKKGRQQSNINSVVEKRFLRKPTITPRQKREREADHIMV